MPIIKAVLTYFSTVSVLWWHTTGVIREQWSHANSVYNEMLKSSDAHNLIAVSLAIDLLILDLWAHRSFCECLPAFGAFGDCDLLKAFGAVELTCYGFYSAAPFAADTPNNFVI